MGHNNSLNRKAYSKSSFLTFQKGTLPLVISVPHGGYNKPTSIPDRKRNGSLLLADTYTKEIALEISRHIENYYNKKPYIVASNISRRKVDMNRSIDEGAETDRARAIWREYHKHLEGSIESVRKHYKYGLVVDIHGKPILHYMHSVLLI
jgi:N-formylglutamate amidohydrolase